jgi:hypothetical protein
MGTFRITTGRYHTSDLLPVACKDYHHLILAHGFTPQTGFLDSHGRPAGRQSRGVLHRDHVHVRGVQHIGKEANELELVQAGLISDEEEILTVYEQDPWEKLWPIVAKMSVQEIREVAKYSRSMAYMIRRGERRPTREKLLLLNSALRGHRM